MRYRWRMTFPTPKCFFWVSNSSARNNSQLPLADTSCTSGNVHIDESNFTKEIVQLKVHAAQRRALRSHCSVRVLKPG